MKIGIIGQGASGVILALMLKQFDQNIDITMFDHNEKTNKKLLATGNGRCNLGNLKIYPYTYNSSFANNLIKGFPINKQREFFASLGLETRTLENLVYPYSLSSNQVVAYLNKLLKYYKVKFVNGGNFDDYAVGSQSVSVSVKNKIYKFDKLVIATGGMSKSTLGSDGSTFNILKKHDYEITPLKVGLAPVKVLENVRNIENERLKCKVSLFINKDKIYEETGEVLFKKDGLSGIAIFNCSSMIARSKNSSKIKIVLDVFPDISENDLYEKFEKYWGFAGFLFLEGVFPIRMADFIKVNSHSSDSSNFNKEDIRKIVKYCKNMTFTYKATYPFSESQVTVGGVSLNNLNNDLSSKLEKNVYFAGEVIDIDGLCGGYNLMLAFASSYRVFNSIIKDI